MVRLARDDDEWGFLREPCSNSINGKEMLQVSFSAVAARVKNKKEFNWYFRASDAVVSCLAAALCVSSTNAFKATRNRHQFVFEDLLRCEWRCLWWLRIDGYCK